MRIFVAGATGVIGQTLTPALVKAGHEVTGMTHDASRVGLIESMGAKAIVAGAFNREAGKIQFVQLRIAESTKFV